LHAGARQLSGSAAVEWILLIALLALFAGRGLLPAWRNLNTDFPNYYLVASLYRRGIPLERVYEWTWLQRQADHLGVPGLVGFVPNPPTCALPVLPLTSLSPLTAKRVWLVLNLGFLGLALWSLHGVTRLSWRRLLLLSLMCVAPLRANFLFGQYYVLVLLLVCVAYRASNRGHPFTSGMLLAAAGMLKLFPALFLLLFLWKRDWRSAAGLVCGVVAFTAVSIGIFGMEVHRLFLTEVLPQVLRGGDVLAPYDLQRNSFITLWSHLFLFEPELNRSPLLNSPLLYALVQAGTVTTLLLGFLFSTSKALLKTTQMLEWAAFVPLLLLLSTTTGSYHYSVLVFTVVVGCDALLLKANKRHAFIFLLLFAAVCAPIPSSVARLFPLTRLSATLALYFFLLHAAMDGKRVHIGKRWLAAAFIVGGVFAASNLRSVRNRDEDFARRISNPSTGYRAGSPVAVASGVAFTEMRVGGYRSLFLQEGNVRDLSLPPDVLSISGNESRPILYAELTGRQSFIAQLPIEPMGTVPDILAEGQEPVVSPNGRWLAFLREENGRSAAWLAAVDSKEVPRILLQTSYRSLDLSVSPDGDVIAAVGNVSDPHLVLVRRGTAAVELTDGIVGPVRYPSISPDGKRLAFSRRERGSWHLIVRQLATGAEQQLTHTACNAISASWQDDQTLLYATDCGRGVGLSALARVTVPQ